MQLVSDLQQRPSKGRLPMEKQIVSFYDLCSLVQLITFLIHTVLTSIGASRTFKNAFFVQSDFALDDAIVYKTRDCVYNSTRSIYAFTNVTTSFTANNVDDVFVDLAIQMRLAIFIMAVGVFFAGLNHNCVESNFFVLKVRNFYFWKDMASATELLLLCYVYVIAASAQAPQGLLRDYLRYCGVESSVYLPFVSVASMYVFASVGIGSYVVGMTLYLWNSLPKYGIMSPAEIAEYKEWLRARQAEREQSRAFIEQAKQAQARMVLLQSAEYNAGAASRGPVPPPMLMMATPEQQRAAMAAGAFPSPYGYAAPMWAGDPYRTQPNPHLPPPQQFGMQPALHTPPPYPTLSVPGSALRRAQPAAPLTEISLPPSSVNMPRRRNTAALHRPQPQRVDGGASPIGPAEQPYSPYR